MPTQLRSVGPHEVAWRVCGVLGNRHQHPHKEQREVVAASIACTGSVPLSSVYSLDPWGGLGIRGRTLTSHGAKAIVP
jgi:hypothetical protein